MRHPYRQRTRLWWFLALLVFLGCSFLATRKGFYEPITADLQSGKYESAVQKIEAAKDSKKFAEKDRFLYFIDSGLAHFYASQYDISNTKLTLAENAAEELFTKSVSRTAASLLLNDNVLEYPGEDYEVLYTNLFKALNYLELKKFDDAFVEIRRANLKLELLEQKYAVAAEKLQRSSPDDAEEVRLKYDVKKVRFHNDAFARYMSMHMYAADGMLDDARIDYDWLHDAFVSQSHVYSFPVPDVKYTSTGKAILSVVAMAGLSPVKEALNLRIRTDKDLDLVQVLYDGPGRGDEEYGHFPLQVSEDYYFKFAIPVIASRPSFIDRIRILVDGEPAGELGLLEDVGKVAQETFEAKKSLIYVRSVARAVAKGLAAHELKEEADKKTENKLARWLKKAAIDVGTDIIENADLRCSRLLPGRILIGDFEIEPGTYTISVEFLDQTGAPLHRSDYPHFPVKRGAFNLIKSFSLN
ncbi:MAG: hypothetical protein JSV84_12075 [Gemmatimonadota bacterium]|nr:MAG: hypothetical protein JSV84_12075 [Gemmatimonadota bacterium]